METEEETKSSPTAVVNGLFSGAASLTIARNDDAVLLGSSPEVNASRDSIVRFGFGAGDAWETSSFAAGCICGGS